VYFIYIICSHASPKMEICSEKCVVR
jgi:hypothetical protein